MRCSACSCWWGSSRKTASCRSTPPTSSGPRALSRHDAIVEANHTRLRPILMTTVMLVAAMVPIALGNGPGAGARASMAKVIIGGQMLSLVLALLVTPVFYALLDMFVNFTRRLGIRFSVEPEARGSRRSLTCTLRPSGNGVAIETEAGRAGTYA